MRGSDQQNGSLFSYVNLEARVPARLPLRKVKAVVDPALASLDAVFDRRYAGEGRPSVVPERLLRAALIQSLFSIRSERQLMEQLAYNLLRHWPMIGVGMAHRHPALRTVRAVFPHTALQSVVSSSGLSRCDSGCLKCEQPEPREVGIRPCLVDQRAEPDVPLLLLLQQHRA